MQGRCRESQYTGKVIAPTGTCLCSECSTIAHTSFFGSSICQYALAQALIWHSSAAIAALLAHLQFTYPPLIKGVIAYGGFQLFWIFGFWLLFIPFTYVIKRIFFWVIDVVPAHGANAEEAMAVATIGPAYELNKKFDHDIEHWTAQDTSAFVELATAMVVPDTRPNELRC